MFKSVLVGFALWCSIVSCIAQPARLKDAFPAGTIFHQDIPYAADTLKKHRLDIYLPAAADANLPVVIWVHGGAWMHGDRYADMSYMKKMIRSVLENGFALGSIDYRHSRSSIIPA